MKVKSRNEIALKVRREWGFNPCTKIVQSKKAYNRRDKSWKQGD